MCLEYREKKKIHKILTTSLKIWTLPLTKIFYINPPPMSMTTLISKTTEYDYSYIQNYSPFLSRVTKGKYIK